MLPVFMMAVMMLGLEDLSNQVTRISCSPDVPAGRRDLYMARIA
jgi:hypothetical protein